MKLPILALAVAAAATAIATGAVAQKPSALPTPPPPSGAGLAPGDCFRSSDMRNHTIGDRQTLLVDVQGKGAYRVTMKGSCLAGATSSDPIVTRSPPGAALICKPIDMDISISRAGFPSPCIVDSVVRMTPEEVAALPPKLKP
ncbi:DUF6491 family protein [Phenylobacterium sp.]|uniref:DUF6491 family protein n=1 Tax=Phenylobacterium sp. TaxID=1871053 RepID=UPI00301CAF1F